MGFAFNVFVSSSCYELRDMRARLQEWLSGMGFNPILSEGEGFPHADGMPPYASCLKTMDECTMVIGVIERQYGTPFDDWGPFPQYKGLAPTHAELRHALNTGKRVLIYVQDGTWNFYDVWRRNPDAFAKGAPHGLDVRTLEMLHELKTRTPEPWLSRYDNASSVVASLKSEVINQLFQQLRERERETADLQQYLLGKLDEASPEIRQGIAEALNSDLVASRDALKAQLERSKPSVSPGPRTKGSATSNRQSSPRRCGFRKFPASSGFCKICSRGPRPRMPSGWSMFSVRSCRNSRAVRRFIIRLKSPYEAITRRRAAG